MQKPLITLLLVTIAALAQSPAKPWYERKGVLGNAKAAEQVADVYLRSLYDNGYFPKEAHLEAKKRGTLWVVEQVFPATMVGEPLEIWIKADNGQVSWVRDVRTMRDKADPIYKAPE